MDNKKDKMKICLLVIYNHRYDKNISTIEKIYYDKFKYIYHIIPFYNGNKNNVITVYESSYYFQGYISQAYQHIKNKGFTHFFIIADDMLINPHLNENNLFDKIGINEYDVYFPNFRSLNNSPNWIWKKQALNWKITHPGVEIQDILPKAETVKKIFREKGYPLDEIEDGYKPISWKRKIFNFIFRKKKEKEYIQLPYPLLCGYSDIMIIPSTLMDTFCLYCGAFAATNLFVENAIPTTLAIIAPQIKFDNNCKLKYGAMWTDKDSNFLQKYNFSLSELINNFPKEKLFLHPIKLSKWKL
ncbi:MAG: hypothetical protein PUC50_03635 [Bacteroidales bacterium]|nr:hypothetical protein [Bacteroidales bacterium]